MRSPFAVLIAPLLPALVACAYAALPSVAGDPVAARDQLRAAATSGAIPLVVLHTPEGLPPEMAAAALARGIRGLDVRFAVTDQVRSGSLVVSFAKATPEELCRGGGATAPPLAAGAPTMLLVWCGAPGAVASVETALPSTAPQEVERALWRGAFRLFPDDYAERYGMDLFGLRIGIGASIGF